jgi:hypothetical protein
LTPPARIKWLQHQIWVRPKRLGLRREEAKEAGIMERLGRQQR